MERFRVGQNSLLGEPKNYFRCLPGTHDDSFGPFGVCSRCGGAQVILPSLESRKSETAPCIGARSMRVQSVGGLHGDACICHRRPGGIQHDSCQYSQGRSSIRGRRDSARHQHEAAVTKMSHQVLWASLKERYYLSRACSVNRTQSDVLEPKCVRESVATHKVSA
jgi:hypothetical protein